MNYQAPYCLNMRRFEGLVKNYTTAPYTLPMMQWKPYICNVFTRIDTTMRDRCTGRGFGTFEWRAVEHYVLYLGNI